MKLTKNKNRDDLDVDAVMAAAPWVQESQARGAVRC